MSMPRVRCTLRRLLSSLILILVLVFVLAMMEVGEESSLVSTGSDQQDDDYV